MIVYEARLGTPTGEVLVRSDSRLGLEVGLNNQRNRISSVQYAGLEDETETHVYVVVREGSEKPITVPEPGSGPLYYIDNSKTNSTDAICRLKNLRKKKCSVV